MVPQILARVGPGAVADWMLHLVGLAAYTFLDWDAKAGTVSVPACLPACLPASSTASGGRHSAHNAAADSSACSHGSP